MMGLITQFQQYQSFLTLWLFSRFLCQLSIVKVLVLKLGQSQNIAVNVCGSEEENSAMFLTCTWNGHIGTFQ